MSSNVEPYFFVFVFLKGKLKSVMWIVLKSLEPEVDENVRLLAGNG